MIQVNKIKHSTLPANTEVIFEFGTDVKGIEIINRTGEGELFYLVDPTDDQVLSIEGDDCEIIPAAINTQIYRSRSSAITIVKIICLTECKITIKDVDND